MHGRSNNFIVGIKYDPTLSCGEGFIEGIVTCVVLLRSSGIPSASFALWFFPPT